MKSIFVKKSTGWTETKSIFIKKLVSGVATWVKVYTKLSLPDTTTPPSIRTTNTSGVGDAYDGPAAVSPRFLNDNLFGKDGVYTNFTSKFGRKFTKADAAAALPSERLTVVTGDLFTSGGGVTTSDRTGLDGKYLFFELTVQNGSSANEIQSVSSPIKMIKREPATTDFQWTQVEQVGTQLVLNYVYENYYYNSISPGSSYIKWWRNTSDVPGGTLIKSETITDTTTGTPNTTSRSGTSYYTPTVDDIGYYVVAETTAVNSNTVHFGYTDNYTVASWSTTEPIGAALSIIDVNFTDSNGRSGKNARGNLVTATSTTLNWKVTGISPSTTYRVRYRVLNNQNGLYYNPFSATQLAASAAWEVYEDNYYGTGNISSVSISGSTATLYDVFTINETFNGSTYGGGLSRYSFEYELSVVPASGVRRYWVYPESMSSSQTHDYWDIDPTTNPSISASPSTVVPNGTVTFSGTFNSYPAGLNSYPHSYRIVYGTSPATDSGWITLSSGTANQTYSNTKTYSTAGSYTAYIETTPYYTTNSASVTVSNLKVPPTIGTPTLSSTGAFVSGQRRLSVPFTAVTGSGPSYQIYWYYNSTKPSVASTPDGSGTTSPILDESGPTSIGRCYVYIRSSATNTTSGSVAPSTTLSDWSDGAILDISGTRTLSYDDNTTDTVSSFPASSSGTDPWDGWVTTVSSNTPTRTGYTFNGYNTSSDGTSGTNYAAGAAITLTSNVTLYAKWTANTYAVTYYGNSNTGGSVPDAQTKTHGVNLTLRTNVNTLTRTGYTFAGWNTNSSGTGTDYAAGATYSGNAALDLYAKWTETVTLYTVTFSANGATGSPSVSSVTQSTSGGSVTLASIGTMAGGTNRIFGGWRTGTTSGTVYAFGATYTPTSNITLYAYYGTQPTCSAPSLNFRRYPNNSSTSYEYFADYPTPSGAYTEIIGMQYEIYSANSTGGSTVTGGAGTLAYPTGGDLYPYQSTRDGTYWSFLVRSGEGGRTTAAVGTRFARVRVRMRGIDGVNYPGTYTSPLL